MRLVGAPVGEEPIGLPRPGLGRHFSNDGRGPVLLEEPSEHGHLVQEFDELAGFYEILVRPFSTPIFDEALAVIHRYLAHDSRVLDAGCGPGRELRRVAALVPRGEAVGIDLAAGMVEVAHAAARRRGLDTCAVLQADVGRLPRRFDDSFDLVYSCLAHHHYPDPAAAAASVLRCLRPGRLLRDRSGPRLVQRAQRAARPTRRSGLDRLEDAAGVPSAPRGGRVRAPAGSRSSPASGSRSARSPRAAQRAERPRACPARRGRPAGQPRQPCGPAEESRPAPAAEAPLASGSRWHSGGERCSTRRTSRRRTTGRPWRR